MNLIVIFNVNCQLCSGDGQVYRIMFVNRKSLLELEVNCECVEFWPAFTSSLEN